MRELKFRAWLLDNYDSYDSKMNSYIPKWKIVPVHSLHIGTNKIMFTGGTCSSPRSQPINEECIIEQFTGLRDKNGKDIYEGDIINQWVDLGPGGEGLYISQVFITNFGPTIMKWEYDEDGYMPEVIGNIHENHNLLD